MGSLFALNTVSMAVCAIPAGFIADRLGRRKSFVFGAAPSLVVAALKLTTTNIAFLRLLFMVDGAFIMLFLASSSPFIVENTEPENRMHAFSLSAMMMLGAGIFGNLLGGYLPQLIRLFSTGLSDVIVYRVIFIAATGLLLTAFTFLFKILDPPIPLGVTPSRKLVLPGKKDMAFLLKYMIAAGFISLGAAHFMPFATTFFRRTYGASSQQLGILFSLTQLAVFVATAVAPALAQRWSPVPAIILTRIVSLPLLFGISTVSNFHLAGGLFMLRNAFMQMSSPLETNFVVSNISPEVRATANGINNMVMSSLRAIANYSAGIIITRTGAFSGYPAAIQVMLACYIISTVFWYVFFVRGSKAKLTKPKPQNAT